MILSGLLPHQANSVVAAYRGSGLKLVEAIQIDGWSSLLMQRASALSLDASFDRRVRRR